MSLEFLDLAPPAPGSAVAGPAGLRWIRLPVPGPLAHINVWLAPGARGCVLIDTGLNQPETEDAWAQLAISEQLAGRLSAIVVTHHHPDHLGMAASLAQHYQVPVRMSAAAHAAALRSTQAAVGVSEQMLLAYRDTWGVDFGALVLRARGGGAYDRLVSGIPAAAAFIGEGDTLEELRDPWRASLHHGHAEGHVCLHLASAAVLISGDQLLPSISSNVSLYPGAGSDDPLADFLASLERLAQLPPHTLVLPAHGQPFRGAAARAAQLRAGHEQRLAQLSDFAAVPRTVPQIVAALFGARNLEGWNSLLAYGETLAHMRYLAARGQLARLTARDEVHWQRA